MDGKNKLGGHFDRNLNRQMLLGTQFFTHGNYSDAANCFRDARDASIQNHGESSLECAIARYSYGLCLLCQVPVPVDDPMLLMPKEVHYYAASALPFPTSAFRRHTGVMEEKDVKMLEDGMGELNLAWSLVEYRIDNYVLKANILSALGEVAFRRGELNPQRHYFEASSIFDSLYGENNERVADIYVKLLTCLEGSDKSKAIEYGKKARLFYNNRIMQLLGEATDMTKKLRQLSRAALEKYIDFEPPTDPSIQQIKKEVKPFLIIVADLENKLERLEPGSYSLSLNQEGTSVAPADHSYARQTVQVNTNLEL